MKKILLLAGVLVALSAGLCMAQSTEGVIDFDFKVNMHRNIPKDNEGIKAMIPEFRTSQFQLFFSAGESLFKPVEEDDDEEASNNNGVQIKMRMPLTEVYTNPADQQVIELREFMDKKYLVTDTLKASGWKLSAETKTILGYECKKATKVDTARKQTTVVWFTDKVRSSLGPDRYSSLPGTVLEVNINEGERIYIARKIDARSLKKGEIKIPSGGTPISGAAFRKMVDEQMKKMGGSGGIIIRRN
ncbi:MAG: GLPGLI family protein [Bacteroidetes bacterium]|nr:GLPGLI family protein [Bacteroidota bacterium]